MAKTWKDILGDKAIADNLEITIGTDKFLLGDLRGLNSETQGQVAKALQEAADKKSQLDGKLLEAATVYSQLQEELNKAKAAPLPQKTTGSEPDYSADPVLGPLAAQLAKQQESINALQKSLTDSVSGLKRDVTTAVGSYIGDEWGRKFNAMPELSNPVLKDIYSGLTLQEALKFADAHKIVDHRGVTDPVQAAHQMLRDKREEAIRKSAREEGRTEGIDQGRKQQREAMPRPGNAGRREVVQPKYKNMDEAMAHVGEDPEVADALDKLAGVSIQ